MAEILHIKEIVTTDPGVDDAVAVLVGWAALKNPAVVAIHGNTSTEQAGRNLNTLLHFENTHRRPDILKPEPMVFVGVDRATGVNEPFDIALPFIHGQGAMEGMGIGYPPIKTSSRELYEYLNEINNGPVDVFSYGAVTEVHNMLDGKNGFRSGIKSLTLMGGAIAQMGNTGIHQEANLRHDPNAMREIVRYFDEKGILTVVPIDVTQEEKIEFSFERIVGLADNLWSRGSKDIATYILRLVGPDSTYYNFYRNARGIYDLRQKIPTPKNNDGPSVHDLTALIVKLHPEIFVIDKFPLKVENDGTIGIAAEHMGIDGWVNVAMALQPGGAEKYWQYTEDYLASHYT